MTYQGLSRRLWTTVLLTLTLIAAARTQRPDWAFFVPTAASARLVQPVIPNATSWGPAGSHQSRPIAQLQDVLAPPDWYPEEHPALPGIVARGIAGSNGQPPLLPCALCHLPNGAGHVESASLAGLPADYIERQFADWRSGARKIAVGNAQTKAFLTSLKQRYSSEQIRDASQYFASLKPRRWIQVEETDSVPISAVDADTLMRLALPGRRTEPIGHRIVELPLDPVALINRDSHSGFRAYVPKGSVAAGEALSLVQGADGLPPCTACHGPKLSGSAAAPPIAGRPPTYLVRQLWAYQIMDRTGDSAAGMRLIVARLRPEQMLDIAAYLASLPP